jgi:putative FmdB family regulatory protein
MGGIVPTYQYACTECGGQLEAVQKFTDEALSVHEGCGGRLRKVFSPVGIVFKGSGFYRTDSRSGSSASVSSGASGGTADSGSAGSASGGEKGSGEKGSGEKGSSAASSSGTAPAASSASPSGEKVA